MAFSRNGKYRIGATNEDARSKIKILEEANGQIVGLPSLPEGDISGISISDTETKMAFYHDGSRAPANLYVYDFKTRNLAKLTESLNPEINAADLVDGRVVRYKSFDGLEIPAILYQPHGVSAQQKVPAIVKVHGGPGGQARMPYSASTQFLVNHGYCVLNVNSRESCGHR